MNHRRTLVVSSLAIVTSVFLAGHLHAQATTADLLDDFQWRNIGPANMMGRISAIDARNNDYRHVLIGSASGGVFKSTNAGMTWTSIFDDYGAGSIGDVALFPGNSDIIWVGTGEATNRNSVGWGDGIYKSTDGGETFVHMGLENTHQIAEIAVHPSNKEIVYAAAIGHLWGYSGDRGLFKTTDGGDTWEKLANGLPDDGKTGATEVIMDPANPDVLYAGMYHRLRQPADFHSGGPNGGIFKTTDGGQTWRKLANGLPTGDTGQIDISIFRKDPRIVVANVEADESLPDDLSVPGPGIYRSDDGGESWNYLHRHNTRPFYHGQIEIDPLDDQRIYAVSRSFQVSKDGGTTWGRRWWGGGGDDHDMWIAPYDSKIRYMATDQGAHLTIDDGETVLSFNNMAIGQYYAIGVDMRDPYWVIGGLQDNGIWMGPSNSRERRGILNGHNTWVAEGDGFHSQIDPTDWRTIYSVNHVGFVARQNVDTRQHTYITPTPETTVNFVEYVDFDYPVKAPDYTISPGEHWFFGVRPDRPPLPPQFRFNWSSPFIISPNNPRTIYFGSSYLFKSVDRGDTWRIVSPDLTTNDPALRNPNNKGGLTTENTGGEHHCTIITIAESSLDPGVVWVGTDDGNVQVTRNGGGSWTNVRDAIPGIPPKIWVSRVEASHFDAGSAYVSLDNHRYDDTKPYVFKTTDFGATWTDISSNLPDGSAYVIRGDFKNPNLLFVGTEFALHASVDGGKSWSRMMSQLPTVAIHDLVIHPRDADLVAGTHGRSIWIADDITPLQQLTDEVLAKDVHVFDHRIATKWVRINQGRKQPDFEFRGTNPPSEALIHFYLKQASKDLVKVEIQDGEGQHKEVLEVEGDAGINRVEWNLIFKTTPANRVAFKKHLHDVMDRLSQLVRKPEETERLAELRTRLDEASTKDPPPKAEEESEREARERHPDNLLNQIRRDLVWSFSVYAGGKPFFGDKLAPVVAPAGEYRVTLRVEGESYDGALTLRDDPLVSHSVSNQ